LANSGKVVFAEATVLGVALEKLEEAGVLEVVDGVA
jgi:hypothetical protein